MSIIDATRAYERWAQKRIDFVPRDLRLKHDEMARKAFPFLRATFYRWVGLWQETCPEFADAPQCLAIGDLHVENFGTWRDREGRLAWGINDFDEAFPMPYAIDLVRLATSALLAIRESALHIAPDNACAEILRGYRIGIAANGARSFVLEEAHPALRAMALGAQRDPVRFWARFPTMRRVDPPRAVRKLLLSRLPETAQPPRFAARVAGLGSLGRPRFVAFGDAEGGLVAREAKAMLPSAYGWATKTHDKRLYLEAIVRAAIRSPDPYYEARKGWVLRRLAPHNSRIPLGDFPQIRDEARILHAMGHETANVHWGSPDALPAIRRHIARKNPAWLADAAKRMAEATLADWRQWRRQHGA